MISELGSQILARARQGWFKRAKALNQKKLELTEQRSLDELKALPREELPEFVANCPVSMNYLEMLGDLPWKDFPHLCGSRGPEPMNRAAFVAAFLIKVDQGYKYMSELRKYLCQHPALVWLLGFPVVVSATEAHGFDVEKTLVCQRQFSRVLKKLARSQLEFMLEGSVKLLKESLPKALAFGEAVSLDTKHILAWVKENNPKAYVTERYAKTKQLKGDPDCKLGCKKKQSSFGFVS
jgi:hypothetical protein